MLRGLHKRRHLAAHVEWCATRCCDMGGLRPSRPPVRGAEADSLVGRCNRFAENHRAPRSSSMHTPATVLHADCSPPLHPKLRFLGQMFI